MAIKNKLIQKYIKNKEFVGIEISGDDGIIVGHIHDIDVDWLELHYKDKSKQYEKTVLVSTEYIKSISPTSFQNHKKMQKEEKKFFEQYKRKETGDDVNYVG